MVTANIEIDTGKDKVITTAPPYRINMANVEVEEPSSATAPRIEIPERRRREAVDSGSDGSDYAFLANPKKLTAPKEIPLPVETKDPDDNNHHSDSDSGRSRRSAQSWKSHHSSRSHKSHHTARSRRSEQSEYRPRYSMPDSGTRAPETGGTPPLVNSMFTSGLFSRRTHAMTEDDIRKEKSYLLQQYLSKNRDQTYSPKRLSMDNSLEEIQNELQFIVSKREMENNMTTWKRGFMLFADSMVALNSSYDPFNFKVDLSDWARDMHYDIFRDGKYDEVLEELIMKWRGKVPMSPEMKLLFMAGSSLVFGVMAKKKEAAVLAKRMEADKQMEQRIEAAVEKKFAQKLRMQQQQQQQAQQQQQQQPQYSAAPTRQPGYTEPSFMAKSSPSYVGKTRVRPASPVLQGPSLSDADYLKLLEANIIDSTIEDDDTDSIISGSTITSRGNNRNEDEDTLSISMTTSAIPAANADIAAESTAVKVTKPARGKAKVKVEKDGDEDEETTTAAAAKKTATKKAAATTTGTATRARGRPRKNPLPSATVVTLENF